MSFYEIEESYIIENPSCLRRLKCITYELINKIIETDGINLQHVPDEFLSYDLQMKAIENNPKALKYVKEQTEEMQHLYIDKCNDDYFNFYYLDYPSYDICKKCIQYDPYYASFIDTKYTDLRYEAINNNPNILLKLDNVTCDEINTACDIDDKFIILKNDTTEEIIYETMENNLEWARYIVSDVSEKIIKNFPIIQTLNIIFKKIMIKNDFANFWIYCADGDYKELKKYIKYALELYPDVEKYLKMINEQDDNSFNITRIKYYSDCYKNNKNINFPNNNDKNKYDDEYLKFKISNIKNVKYMPHYNSLSVHYGKFSSLETI